MVDKIQMSQEEVAQFVLKYLEIRGPEETQKLIIEMLSDAYNKGYNKGYDHGLEDEN